MIRQPNQLSIVTQEGIEIPICLASPVQRLLALIIDFCSIQVLLSVTFTFLGPAEILLPGLVELLYVVATLSLQVLYGTLCEWYFHGQTLGKFLLKMRVIDVNSQPLEFNQIFLRNLVRPVDAFPAFYLLGGFSCMLSHQNQRLGDLLANTIVISSREATIPNLSHIMKGRFNSFRNYPHLVNRLKKKINVDQVSLAIEALQRRDELDPVARLELFKEMRAHFETLVSFPEEITFSLNDEQYIRNLVDVLCH